MGWVFLEMPTSMKDCMKQLQIETKLPPKLSRGQVLSLIIGGVLTAALFFSRDHTVNVREASLALAIMWLAATPGITYLGYMRCQKRPFPLMPGTGIFYGISFGLPTFLAHRLRTGPNGEIEFYNRVYLRGVNPETQVLLLVGIALMFVSWFGARWWAAGGRINFATPGGDDPRLLQVLAWGMALAGSAYFHLPQVRALPSVGQLLIPAGFLALSMFFILWRRRQLPRLQAVVYFFAVAPDWLLQISSGGSVTLAFMAIFFLCVLYIMEGGALPWKSLAIGGLLFVLIYPILNEYRTHIWVGEKGLSTYQKAIKFGEMAKRYYLKPGIPATMETGLIRRISLLFTFGYVVEKTPDVVSYWGGVTYAPLPGSWIPRAIWPGKPREESGNAFGRRYDILKRGAISKTQTHLYPDHNMSLNIPWITEMYANFGWLGVIVGMFLVGAVLGLLEAFFFREGIGLAQIAVGVTVMLPLFFQESNLSLMTGSVLPLTLCLWAYFQVGLRLPLFRPDAG